ncbi:hypothetical protein HO173_010773 [Letharia columbiana]|uniref:Uncharacterized protein n=1 Tax=Letharia columbiana TaxID=112416 RepID=A0A8H6L0K7_9LECA|nr:uncharacterized protein HO173_010773 [Letharia columbiana]KAF6231073.1 hypothetical protein HO173_010773 [Letharia columbiana]
MQRDPRQSTPLEAARGTHPNTFVRDITQPEEFKVYTDYDAYAHSTGEDENKVNLAEGEADSNTVSAGNDQNPPSMHPAASILEYDQANTYKDLSGRRSQTADPPLISPTPSTPTSGPSTHPPAQLPLPQFQPASTQVGNPTQPPATPAPNYPLPIPRHPLHETIPGMTLGWTTCNTDHRRHAANTKDSVGTICHLLANVTARV